LGGAEIGDGKIEPTLDLAISVFGKTNSARLGDALKPRCDVDAVAHQIAVALLDHIAHMNADTELDPALGRHSGIAFDHRVLQFNGAAHRIDNAAEFDDAAVAGALDNAAAMHGDGRVDEIAAKRAKPGEDAIFVRAGEPAVADDVGHQDRYEFSGLTHCAALWPARLAHGDRQMTGVRRSWLILELRARDFADYKPGEWTARAQTSLSVKDRFLADSALS
jgi:hypothetical protein